MLKSYLDKTSNITTSCALITIVKIVNMNYSTVDRAEIKPFTEAMTEHSLIKDKVDHAVTPNNNQSLTHTHLCSRTISFSGSESPVWCPLLSYKWKCFSSF